MLLSPGSISGDERPPHEEPPLKMSAPPQEDVELVPELREIWQAKLDRDFPGRHVRVFFNDTDEGDLLDSQVTFFQDPPEQAP